MITEVLVSWATLNVNALKQRYNELFKRDLEKDVISETSGHLKRIYVSILSVRLGSMYRSLVTKSRLHFIL